MDLDADLIIPVIPDRFCLQRAPSQIIATPNQLATIAPRPTPERGWGGVFNAPNLDVEDSGQDMTKPVAGPGRHPDRGCDGAVAIDGAGGAIARGEATGRSRSLVGGSGERSQGTLVF